MIELHSRAWQPTPRCLAIVIISRLEDWSGKSRLDVQDRFAAIGKSMFAAGRHNDQLAARQSGMLVVDPDVSLPCADTQNFFYGVQMVWRAVSGVTPLFERAQLRRIIGCRSFHTRPYARAPFLAWLPIHINDTHQSPKFARNKPSLANNTGTHKRV